MAKMTKNTPFLHEIRMEMPKIGNSDRILKNNLEICTQIEYNSLWNVY